MNIEKVNENGKIIQMNNDFCLSLNKGVFYKLEDENSKIEIYNYNPDDGVDDENSFSFYIKFYSPFPAGHEAKDININTLLEKLHNDNDKKYKEENLNRVLAQVGKYKNILKVLVDNDDIKSGYTSIRETIGDIPLINEQVIENFTGYVLTNKGIYLLNSHYNYFYGMPDELEKFMDDILSTVLSK